jgi:hypothetical protein
MNNTSWDWDDLWEDNANPTPVELKPLTGSISNEAVPNVYQEEQLPPAASRWDAEVDRLFGVKGDATQEEVTSSSGYPVAPPSPSELANLSPWDRAYEQALELWRKEHPNLSRAEAMRSFQNDDQYLTRVSTIFQNA